MRVLSLSLALLLFAPTPTDAAPEEKAPSTPEDAATEPDKPAEAGPDEDPQRGDTEGHEPRARRPAAYL